MIKKTKIDFVRIFQTSFAFYIVGMIAAITIFNLITKPSIKMSYSTQYKLENIIYMELKKGNVIIKLLPEYAPKHVEQIKRLTRKKFYDGLTFHRVIEGFVAQGGDPKGNGTGGSGRKIPAEFSNLKHKRGAVSMARGMDVNSADSQFFIVLEDRPDLDGNYTIWGQVIEGMEYVDQIKKGDMSANGAVTDPDQIISMRVAIDVEKDSQSKKQ